jgi:hypothetical protein
MARPNACAFLPGEPLRRPPQGQWQFDGETAAVSDIFAVGAHRTAVHIDDRPYQPQTDVNATAGTVAPPAST